MQLDQYRLMVVKYLVYLKDKKQFSCFLLIMLLFCTNNKNFTSVLVKEVDKTLESSSINDIILYTNYDNCSYVEFRGLKPYLDSGSILEE